MSMIDYAKKYWYCGWNVIPVNEDKKPIHEWLMYQTKRQTIEEVEDLWKGCPDANIAIICGDISNLTVLDIDKQRGGKEPAIAINTLKVNTPNGGVHYYFKYNKDVPTKVDWAPGVDSRSQGGYVLAPPSRIEDREYAWVEDPFTPKGYNIADIDIEQWGIEAETPKEIKAQISRDSILDGVSEGKRNNSAAIYAGRLLSRGFSIEETTKMLLAWNLKNQPPLPEKEIRNVVLSIAKKRVRQEEPITKLRSLSLQDLFHIPQNTSYVISPLIAHNDIAIIGGDPKRGKSFLALYLGLCISSGTSVFDRFPIPEKRAVFFVEEEDGISLIQRRAAQLIRGHKIDITNSKPMRWWIREGFHIDNKEWLSELESELLVHDSPVIIFDALVKMHSKDEDRAGQMKEVMSGFEHLRRQFGCTIIIVHHFNKPGEFNWSGREGERLRGSNVVAGWYESALFLRKAGPCMEVTHSTKWSEPYPTFLYKMLSVSNEEVKFVFVE